MSKIQFRLFNNQQRATPPRKSRQGSELTRSESNDAEIFIAYTLPEAANPKMYKLKQMDSRY